MMNTKKKSPKKGKEVLVVMAYKLTGGARGNRVFFEIFGSSPSAHKWIDRVQNEGFFTQLNKKIIIP